MDTLSDILSKKDFDTPAEIRAIKEYVQRTYSADVTVTMQPHSIVISARSAALIGSLRLNAPAVQKAAATEKRIIFRIG